MTKTMDLIHPGEVLYEDFLIPLGVTQHQLAVSIAVPPRRINEIVHGKRRITADTALRLARYFGTSDRFWLNLQSRHDLEVERDEIGEALDAITPLSVAGSRFPIRKRRRMCAAARLNADHTNVVG
jgi:addiction module HigA family antidote